MLNPLLAAGRSVWSALRERVSQLLRANGDDRLRGAGAEHFLVARDGAEMRVPMEVGDYVDFYSSLEHATNLGRIFRPNAEALAAELALDSDRLSRALEHDRDRRNADTPAARTAQARPTLPRRSSGRRRRLDIELEMGFVTGPGNELGQPIDVADASEHIFGLVLVNDWSARDIQAWEYQPLGPFLGKSFATTISPWVVTLEALEPFRVEGPRQEPEPLHYLRAREPWAYEIQLAVELQTQRMREQGDPPRTDLADHVCRHVLERGAAVGARDGQRRGHPPGRSLCVGNDQRFGAA